MDLYGLIWVRGIFLLSLCWTGFDPSNEVFIPSLLSGAKIVTVYISKSLLSALLQTRAFFYQTIIIGSKRLANWQRFDKYYFKCFDIWFSLTVRNAGREVEILFLSGSSYSLKLSSSCHEDRFTAIMTVKLLGITWRELY